MARLKLWPCNVWPSKRHDEYHHLSYALEKGFQINAPKHHTLHFPLFQIKLYLSLHTWKHQHGLSPERQKCLLGNLQFQLQLRSLHEKAWTIDASWSFSSYTPPTNQPTQALFAKHTHAPSSEVAKAPAETASFTWVQIPWEILGFSHRKPWENLSIYLEPPIRNSPRNAGRSASLMSWLLAELSSQQYTCEVEDVHWNSPSISNFPIQTFQYMYAQTITNIQTNKTLGTSCRMMGIRNVWIPKACVILKRSQAQEGC